MNKQQITKNVYTQQNVNFEQATACTYFLIHFLVPGVILVHFKVQLSLGNGDGATDINSW